LLARENRGLIERNGHSLTPSTAEERQKAWLPMGDVNLLLAAFLYLSKQLVNGREGAGRAGKSPVKSNARRCLRGRLRDPPTMPPDTLS
jgi:hypothetical protein